MVTVTSVSTTAPTLFPLIPPLENDQGSLDEITIGCLAKDFMPNSVTFSWNNQNNATIDANKIKSFPALSNTAGSFTSSSQAVVPYNDWQTYAPFFCKASHPAGNKEVRVVRRAIPDCHDPEMIIRAPPLKAFESSYLNSTIVCRVDYLPTEKTTIQWLKDGQELNSGFVTTKPVLQGSGGYSITSELIVLKSEWVTDKAFTCNAESTKVNLTQTVNLQSFCKGSDENCDTKVKVETIPPTFADMYQTKSAKLTCRVSNIPYSTDFKPLNITWTQGSDRKPLETTVSPPREQGSSMLYVEATASVCVEEWNNSQDTFNCKVAFPGLLPQPVDKSLKKPNGGTQYPPSVYVLPPPPEELALQETATVTCLMKDFYPNDFFVKWMRNQEPIGAAEYFTSKATKVSKLSTEQYFAYSMLTISEQDWNAGDTFTCVVGHEALPLQITQKTVDKNTEEADLHVLSKAYLDGIVDIDDDEGLQNLSSILSTFIILFLVSLFYSATVTVIKFSLTFDLFSSLAGSQQQPPSVFPLRPCCSSANGLPQDTITIACLIMEYLPDSAKVTWEPHVDKNNQKDFPPASRGGSSGHYTTSSQVTVSASNFQSQVYTCIVKHPAAQVDIRKTFDKKRCTGGSLKPLQVHLLTPDCNVHGAETSLELECFLRSLSHWKAQVEWLRNEKVMKKEVVTLSGDQEQYFSSYQLSISKESWDKGDRYTCRVTNPPNSQNVSMYNTSKCEACYSSVQQPLISITKPSYRDLLEGSARVICSVVGSHLEHTQVTWQVDGRPSQEASLETVQKEASRNQEVMSTHLVSLAQWEQGTRFTCKVAGLCYEEVTREVRIQRAAETSKPSVAISRAYLDVSLKSTMGLILICDTSGFAPKEISISWKKNNLPLNTTLYDNGPVMPAGKVYSTYSILKIGRDEAGGRGGSYTCVVHHSSSREPLTATEKVSIAPQAPAVELLQSVNREADTVMLKCVAYNYWPQKVTIKWKGGPPNKNAVFLEEKVADGTFRASSHFTIPFDQWPELESNSCEVVHEGTGSRIVRNISRQDWLVPTALTLTLSTEPLCPSPHLGDNTTIVLLCSTHGYSLEDIQVSWETAQKGLKTETFQKNSGRFYTSSNLTLPLGEWNKLQEYTCKVTQPETSKISRRTISKCTAYRARLVFCFLPACKDSSPPPSLYLLKPPLERLFTQQEALFTCLAVGYELDHARLTWLVDGLNHTKDATTRVAKSHANHTQSLQSQLAITKEIWDSGSKVQCIVSHPCSLFESMTRSIGSTKDSSQAKAPSLSLVVPSLAQLMQPTSQAVAWLACEVSGFSPADILVRWKKNNTSVDPSEYITGPPTTGDGQPTFTTQSILKIPASEWESRVLYTCEVGHESLTDMKDISKNLYGMLLSVSDKTAIAMELPSFEDLFLNKSAPLTCRMPFENKTTNWTVSWTMDGEPADPNAVSTQFLKESNSTSWIYGQLWVNLTEWKATVKFTCSINNGQEEMKEDFDRGNATVKPPKVYLQHQSSKEDLNVTLLCLARDFYPGEIFVKWQEENKEVSLKSHEDAHGLKCNHEKQRCSLISILEIPRSKWSMGISYTCLVAHISSENIITRRADSYSGKMHLSCTT
ncbi:hypothetical protein lerEdw1_010175 [Lerista edwardsae]|nr:hypothetical protein lerEdw1_010175 [Lerista edwardsae]